MKKLFAALGLAVMVFAAAPVSAIEFLAPQGSSKDINAPSNEPHRNLYTAGRNANINSPITGDLFVVGQSVNVNGTVEEDLFAAGSSVLVNQPVGGDARAAGASLVINAAVTGDLLIAGGDANIAADSSVGGDLAAAVGILNVNGPINGKAWISGGEIYINSRINGDLKVTAEKSLTFGPKSVVTGKISYKGPKEAKVEDGAQVSTIDFSKREAKGGKGFMGVGVIIMTLGVFLAGWALVHFRKGHVEDVMASVSQGPLMNLFIGLVALIVIPMISIILMITVVGVLFGIIGLLSYALLIIFAFILTAIYGGALLVQLYKKTPSPEATWITVLVGVIATKIVSLVPIAGPLVLWVLFLMVFGALARKFKPSRIQDRPQT